MKICHVTPRIPPDASAISLIPSLLGDCLRKQGHEARFITYFPKEPQESSSPDFFFVMPPASRFLLNKLNVPSIFSSAAAAVSIRSILRGSDIAHFHGYNALVHAGTALCLRYKIPSILTLYGTEIWSYKKKRGFDLFSMLINKKINVVVFYSKGLLLHAEKLGINPKNKTFIYPPVPPYFFAPMMEKSLLRKTLKLDGNPVLLNTKGCFPVSDPETLIRALPHIANRLPEAKLHVLGGGTMTPAMQALSSALGVSKHVSFKSAIPNTLLPEYYAASDAYLLSSKLESYGNIIPEALACGTPVAATETVGACELKEIFPDEISLVPLHDFRALAEETVRMIHLKKSVSEETRTRIKNEFNMENFWEKYYCAYEKALAARAHT